MADKPLEEKKKVTAKVPAAAKKTAVKKTATKKPAAKTATKAVAKKTVAAEAKPKKKATAKVAAAPVIEVPRAHRKGRTGIVISDKMDKSIVVGVEKMYRHPLYRKIVKRTKKFVAHDPEGQASVGDKVDIVETRPISKTKRWRLVKVVEKAK